MAVSDVKHEFREWTDKMTLYQFFNNRVLKFCMLCSLRYMVDFVLLMLMQRDSKYCMRIFLTTVCTISVFCVFSVFYITDVQGQRHRITLCQFLSNRLLKFCILCTEVHS